MKTFTVYTETKAIHGVPEDQLNKMGPKTLSTLIGISEENPWSAAKVKGFKDKQAMLLKEKEQKSKARVDDESVSSWTVDRKDDDFIVNGEFAVKGSDLPSLPPVIVMYECTGDKVYKWSNTKVAAFNKWVMETKEAKRKAEQKAALEKEIKRLQDMLSKV